MKKFIFLFLLIIFCANSYAVSFGKLSSDENYIFEPNLQIVKKYSLGTQEGVPVGLMVVVEGPQNLDEYITTEPERLTTNGIMTLNINLPEIIEGGQYKFVVCGKEIKEETKEGIGIGSQICTQFSMLATLPGKVLKVNSFSAESTDIDSKTTNLVFSVSNWGRETINSIIGLFDAFDIDGKQVAQVLVTTPLTLNSTETKTGIVPLNIGGINPGEFTVRGKLTWDEGEEEVEGSFQIGTADFEILNITDKYFSDDVNDLLIIIKNGYGGDKTPITLKIQIGGLTITPPAFALAAFETKTISAFLDARGFEPGFYDAKVVISVDGESVEKEFKFEFVKKPFPKWPFYLVGIIVLLLIVVTVIFKMRGKHEEETTEPV